MPVSWENDFVKQCLKLESTIVRKILLVFGTRPEAIKMCPLVKELRAYPDKFRVEVCITGQHREMLDQVLEAFDVEPEYDLDIMAENQTLFEITSNILMGIRAVYENAKPDVVLVHGDTTTSFAAALGAFYLGISVGHVEAGLRTFDMRSPFPEEFNRQAVDLIADYYFAPTDTSRDNLLREGKPAEKIYVTGNTGIDALATTVRDDFAHDQLEWASDSRLVLVTAHRRENLGETMRGMFRALKRVVDEHPDVKMLYPVHLNPKVREVAYEILGDSDRIHLIPPLDVIPFHNILARSFLVMTDSGGIQEEAPGLGKPVLVMRDTTERPEGVEAGTLKLVGTDEEAIYAECNRLLSDAAAYRSMAHASNPYGDGRACERIARALASS